MLWTLVFKPRQDMSVLGCSQAGQQARQLWEVLGGGTQVQIFLPKCRWVTELWEGRKKTPGEPHFCECYLCTGLGTRLLPQWRHRRPHCEAARCCMAGLTGFQDHAVCSEWRGQSFSLLCSLFMRGTSLTQEHCCSVQSKHKPKLKCCIQHQSHNCT